MYEAASIVYKIICTLNGDPTPLKDIVDSYVGGVNAYLRFKDQLVGCLSEHDIETKRVEAVKDLESVKSNLVTAKQEESDFVAALVGVKQKRVALEETLSSLLQKESKMEGDLKTKKATVEVARHQVEEAEKALHDVASIPTITTEDAELLQDLSRKIESRQSSLDSSFWMDRYI